MFICIWGYSGCSSKTPESIVSEVKKVGTFIKSINIPTSFNEAVKSNVETTKGSFTVAGSISAMKEDKVVIKKIGEQWFLYIGNNEQKHYVIGM